MANSMVYHPSSPICLGFALALALACTPARPPGTPASAVDAKAADAAADSGAVGEAGAAAAGDIDAETAGAQAPEVALPQCATAGDCGTPGLCWLPTCTLGGTCALVAAATGKPCDDANACSTQDQCSAGVCAGLDLLACDDGEPCTADACNPVSGCLNLPVAASSACDDGDPCTQAESCQQGQCEGGVAICQCKTASDCGKFEDGDLCNGTLYCDKSAGSPYTCKVNPASLITCPLTSNSVCQTNTCVSSTGQCKLVLAPVNTPCDDGIVCTVGDFCDTGQCQGGTNTCFCKNDGECASKEDGNLCNGTLFCNKATAQCQVNPASVVTCMTVDQTACLHNLCNPKLGKCFLVPVQEGKACDDGNACTPNETCNKGTCSSSNNTCECQKDADCLAKEDGNLCNGTLYCDLASYQCKVNPATVPKCDTADDLLCLTDVCNAKTGVCEASALPTDGTACDDGNPCTAPGVCKAGACLAGANLCACQKDADCLAKEDGDLCNGTLFCNLKTNSCDVNPATVVSCTAAFDEACLTNQCDAKTGACGMKPAHQGNQCGGKAVCSVAGWCNGGQCEATGATGCECKKDTDCGNLEDGDLCNGTLYCNTQLPKPMCELNPASVVVCSTAGNTVCSQAKCQPNLGTCKMVAVVGACNDGLACTASDACSAGTCVGGPKVCVDSMPCTADSCAEPFGCLHLPTAVSACDDGNACTAGDACLGGSCVGVVKACDDGNPCTTDACHAEKGCQVSNNTAPCSDNDACTQPDLCQGGACVAGLSTKCDDGSACTQDACDPMTGKCTFATKTGGCGDANPCTDEVCDPKLGCQNLPNAATCSDGNACTTGDLCASGGCVGGAVAVCDDKKPCTQDSCNTKLGCVYFANPAACDDGDACTTDTCGANTCLHQALVCDDGNPCTVDTCAKASGQCQVDAKALDGKTCDADSDGCTLNDACLAGQCKAGPPAVCALQVKPCQQAVCQSTGSKSFDCKAVVASDGTPCVGQDLCIADAFCSAGACKAGATQKLYAVTLEASSGGLQLNAVAAAGDGLWVGGRTVAPNQFATWWLQRLTAGGQPAWSKAWQPAALKPDKAAGIVGLVATPTTVVAAGTVGSDQDGTQLRVVGLALAASPATAPTTLWDHVHGLAGQDERPERLVATSAGYAVVGRVAVGAKDSGWLARLGATGLLQWSWQGGPAAGASLRAAVPQSDGGWLAAGRAVGATTPSGWLVRLDVQGKEQWQVLHGTKEDQGFEALVPLASGEYLAAGWATESGQSRLYLQRVNSAGAAVAPAHVGASPNRVADALAGAAGQLWLAGQSYADPQGDAWLASADATGHLAWAVAHEGGGSEALRALAFVGDGGLVAVGSWQAGTDPTTSKGWVRRSDPWGHSNCAESGVCAAKLAADCADLNGCSDDLCDAKLGCVSQPSGVVCSDGDACTSGDICTGLSCQSGPALVCDDANACTADNCDKKAGCAHAPLNGAPCPDDSVCTSGEVCAGAVCSLTKKNCDDADPCTQDLCDAKSGCVNSTLPESSPCGVGKACISGKCLVRFAKQITCGYLVGGPGPFPQNYALRHDGSVVGMGNGAGGSASAPLKVVAGLADVAHIDAAAGGLCAVQSKGDVRCVGGSSEGKFGNLTCDGLVNSSPQLIPNLGNVAQVDVAHVWGAAATKDGKLWQWGNNGSGQFGLGNCVGCKPSVAMHPTLTDVIAVSSGVASYSYAQMLALKADGSLWAAGSYYAGGYCDSFGKNKYLGDALGTANSASFLKVAIADKVVSFAVGEAHRCAVGASGAVWCWGQGELGQLGNGGKGSQSKPVQVYGLPDKATAVAATNSASCAVLANGQVACWGSNDYGVLGTPAVLEATTPLVVAGLSNVLQLATGPIHICALRGDGSVWCWGYNAGYAGTGDTTTAVTSPKPVLGTQPN